MSADDEEMAGLAALWENGRHLRAGADYLAALQKLGLDPECLFWTEDTTIGHRVLVLVTEQFDRVGPLELSRVLFNAYDRAGTPREINPFILRLHSTRQALIQDMDKYDLEEVRMMAPIKDVFGNPGDVMVSVADMKFRPEWIYKWDIRKKSTSIIDLRRRWRRFADNVDRLAA